jgi:PAS domain-containing protein
MIKNLAPDTLFAMRDAELNALGYGVLITDAKGSIRFANDNFMALKGDLNYRKDGEPFWVAVTIYPLRNPNNDLTHFVAVVRLLGHGAVKPLGHASPSTPESDALGNQLQT